MLVPSSVPIRLRRRRFGRRGASGRPGHAQLAVVRAVLSAVVGSIVRRSAVRCSSSQRLRHDAGQATAEYALVLLGAAAVALMLTAWAARSGAIGDLFDAIVDQLIAKAA
jgi:hypothetical protein